MKKLLLALIILSFFLCTNTSNAQDDFATIKKNVNAQASDLDHFLNETKDTLFLRSEKKIDYVYSISREYKREVYQHIFDTQYNVPLSNLSQGKHVFVVGQSRMKIVFTIWIGEVYYEPLQQSKVLLTSVDN